MFDLINVEKNTFAKLLTVILHKIFKIEENYLLKIKNIDEINEERLEKK